MFSHCVGSNSIASRGLIAPAWISYIRAPAPRRCPCRVGCRQEFAVASALQPGVRYLGHTIHFLPSCMFWNLYGRPACNIACLSAQVTEFACSTTPGNLSRNSLPALQRDAFDDVSIVDAMCRILVASARPLGDRLWRQDHR